MNALCKTMTELFIRSIHPKSKWSCEGRMFDKDRLWKQFLNVVHVVAKFTTCSAAGEQVVEDAVVSFPGEVELDIDTNIFLLFPFLSTYLDRRCERHCEWVVGLNVVRISGGKVVAGCCRVTWWM